VKAFSYERAQSPQAAIDAAARKPGSHFIAGGTNLLDLMKLEIETPAHLIDINALKLDQIESTPEGGLRIGAMVRNTDLAADARVRRDYAVLSRALLAGASAPLPATLLQIRVVETSWIEVQDGRGPVLLSRTVQPGESVGLDGALPLRLTIGNAAATQLVFRGRPVELTAATRDNVARLELK